jgi:hypothetical protein
MPFCILVSANIKIFIKACIFFNEFYSRSQIPFWNAFPQRSALYTSDMTLRVMEGIPKRSLGTSWAGWGLQPRPQRFLATVA